MVDKDYTCEDWGTETEWTQLKVTVALEHLDDATAVMNMVSNYFLVPTLYTPPETLVKGFHLEIDGETVFTAENNYQRFVVIPVEKKCAAIKLVIDELHSSCESARVFRFDFT